MKYLLILSAIILSTSNYQMIAQDNFEEMRGLLRKEKENSLRIKIVQEHLSSSLNQQDTLNIANAYHFFSILKPKDKEAYSDSIIRITKKKGYHRYPATAYLEKGNVKYEFGDYIAALELYIKASKSAKEKNNTKTLLEAKFNIGLLKNLAGDREEAQVIFNDYLNFVEQNPIHKNPRSYNLALYALADAYVYTKKINLASTTIDKGIKGTLKIKDSTTYSYIIVTSGIHQYLLKNYTKAIDSLQKGKDLIKKFDPTETRVATCDYYIARCYKALGENEKSIQYFKKVDTILRKTEDVIPEVRDAYAHLKAYAKSKDDYQLQIEYINTALRLDSIRHANQIYLTKNITRKFDAAELVSEKEQLIQQLEQDKFLKDNTITILVVISIILILITIYGFRKSYVSKKRFQKLLEQQKNQKAQKAELIHTINDDLLKKEDIDIPTEVIETVLEKLLDFEDKNQFAKKHYTLNSLAKELNTNSAYLSKIINVYKNVNFANYLNNLRIDFAVDQLTTNKSLRSYTIQAIAEEVGFKNAQSFSSAFHKKTGIYPSYFIKHLKK
ncbi:helix-turn-helix domain-containing protein [Aquimarina sp. 2201CG14-23]|uniref:helix-turn-helix domain-containing protein n=1 Tax=Aquimarina mycalae TaxID=3040073 RepID=UPI0024780B86|nr:helix-turn-helix domain-containing protein [Aquimarina sp. 2201CG14-23]